MGDDWISLERENRMDFEGELRVARVGNRKDWVEERGTNKEITGFYMYFY